MSRRKHIIYLELLLPSASRPLAPFPTLSNISQPPIPANERVALVAAGRQTFYDEAVLWVCLRVQGIPKSEQADDVGAQPFAALRHVDGLASLRGCEYLFQKKTVKLLSKAFNVRRRFSVLSRYLSCLHNDRAFQLDHAVSQVTSRLRASAVFSPAVSRWSLVSSPGGAWVIRRSLCG
ncbi:hypothetical protein B0H66DRAFT_211324 [Apodospora peruviana]|uniref:Uncharacterized protein n=1 Tax=Apodospora peruviana TaxID=516989 RepID=A0AAE0M7Y4_9PEZI|nr:hypothetical protein B0H66DRAFT_211324 [Apodospora peruviana]